MTRVPEDRTSGPGWKWDARGYVSISSGAVAENLVIAGNIEVEGSAVTVRNCWVRATGEIWGIGLRHTAGVVVQNVQIGEIGKPRLLVGVKDIYGDSRGTVIQASNIVNASTAIQIYEGRIEGNYLHDPAMVAGDHVNGVTSNGGTGLLEIRRNTIFNPIEQTDAIGLFQDFGIEANRLIENNLLAGGAYVLYAGDNRRFGRTNHIVVRGNVFSKRFFPNGGAFGPVTAFDPAGVGNAWADNVWDETGESVEY